MPENSLLENLFDIQISTDLEEVLKEDAEYRETRKQIDKTFKKLKKLELSRKQMLIIDRVVSATNANGSVYGRMAYRKGFQDGIKLLSELMQLF